MKDHNDFFDEMIDVDDESEPDGVEFLEEEEEYELEGADDDDDDDDDGSTVLRTAVLHKNDMLALLSLKAAPDGGQLVRYDPRQPMPSLRRYETEAEARRWYARSLATSRKNGWSVVYDGEPLIG
ncbi:MAG TPA: hypothetical protein VF297_19895 [Pyrinomonadaceae bacterium]